jgi:hypothetical protein
VSYKKSCPPPISHTFGHVHLEVLIESEVTVHHGRRCAGAVEVILLLVEGLHDTSLLVLADALLEEVGLATEGDVLHEVEGVGGVVELLVAECEEQTVGDELNQKIEAKEPEKKMPSTAAKATRRQAKVDFSSLIHRKAQSAFLRMQGMLSMALKRYWRWRTSLM